MNPVEAANYVDITTEEFEQWLSDTTSKWRKKPGTAGVYLIPLSDAVAIQVNSSLARSGQNMGKGGGSIKLKLVSTVTGHVLNKKAQGQNYFTRTEKWRTNVAKGVHNFKQAYVKARGFYEAIARIADRDAYKTELVGLIEQVADWNQNPQLSKFRAKLLNGGILSIADEMNLREMVNSDKGQGNLVQRLRDLYRVTRHDAWTKDFVVNIANRLKSGRPLTPKQEAKMMELLDKYQL